MAPIPPAAFAAALGELDERELAAFVADLWAARGWTTRLEGDTVVATSGGTTQRLLVRHGRPRGRFLPGTGTLGGNGDRPTADLDEERSATGADVIVTSVLDTPRGDERQVIDAAELRRIALYAVDGEDRDRLFDQYLDRSPLGADDGGRDRRPYSDRLPTPSIGVLSLSVVGLVVVGFLVAGAVGFSQSNASPAPAPEQSPVPTPAPVSTSTATPTATPVPRPPGVHVGGATNETALARAHLRRVRTDSYTYRQVQRTEAANGTLLERRGIVIARNGSTERFSIERAGPEAPIIHTRQIYASDTIVEHLGRGNTTEYHQLTNHQLWHRRSVLPNRDDLFSHLLAGTVELRTSSRSKVNGTVEYRLTATDVPPPVGFARIERVESARNLSLWVDVDPSGVVNEYRIAYTAERGDRTVRITRRVTYTDVGSTVPQRPSWYQRAIENGTRSGHHG